MDYQKQGADFLTANGLEFRAILVGDDCPMFCKDAIAERDMDKINVFPRKTHIHGKHYRCTISAKNRGHITFDFWNSYADEEENFFAFGKSDSLNNWVTGRENIYWDKYREGQKYRDRPRAKKIIVPAPYDLLTCIQKYDVGTFRDFCSEFGYDDDSRRAEQTYIAVCKEYQKVHRFFTESELKQLEAIA